MTLSILANAAVDAAGNGNTASAIVRATNIMSEETQRTIAAFMASRAAALVANQPPLACHLTGTCAGGAASVQVSRSGANIELRSRPDDPVWFTLSAARSDMGTTQSDSLFGAFGTHAFVGPDTMVGMMFSFDHAAQTDAAAQISGTGWLAGPYMAMKLPNHPFTLETHLLAGGSTNRISPTGTYTDRFDTRRVLAQLSLAGEMEVGSATLRPRLSGSYTSDRQEAYIDGLGTPIGAQDFAMRSLDLGLDMSREIVFDDLTWQVRGGISAVHSSVSGSAATRADVAYEGTRARIDAGASTRLCNGADLSVGAYLDGIGAQGYRSYGLRLGLDFAF